MAEYKPEVQPLESKPEAESRARAGWGAAERMEGVHSVASDGVHLLRDVASDTVRAAGDVGIVAVDATRDLLVGVADGVRDVLAHVIPARFGGQYGHESRGHERH